MQFSTITLQQRLPPLFTQGKALSIIFPVNAQLVRLANIDANFSESLKAGHCVVDGQVLLWAANARAKRDGLDPFEKLSGSDLVYRVSSLAAEHKRRLLLVGASSEVNKASVDILRRLYNIDVQGYSPPYCSYPLPYDWIEDLLSHIESTKPQVIFFAFGAPKQEVLLAMIRERLVTLEVEVVMTVGGSLDFLAGSIRRAPAWMQRCGLEGLYRLVQQPSLMRLVRILESIAALRYFLK